MHSCCWFTVQEKEEWTVKVKSPLPRTKALQYSSFRGFYSTLCIHLALCDITWLLPVVNKKEAKSKHLFCRQNSLPSIPADIRLLCKPPFYNNIATSFPTSVGSESFILRYTSGSMPNAGSGYMLSAGFGCMLSAGFGSTPSAGFVPAPSFGSRSTSS